MSVTLSETLGRMEPLRLPLVGRAAVRILLDRTLGLELAIFGVVRDVLGLSRFAEHTTMDWRRGEWWWREGVLELSIIVAAHTTCSGSGPRVEVGALCKDVVERRALVERRGEVAIGSCRRVDAVAKAGSIVVVIGRRFVAVGIARNWVRMIFVAEHSWMMILSTIGMCRLGVRVLRKLGRIDVLFCRGIGDSRAFRGEGKRTSGTSSLVLLHLAKAVAFRST